MRNWQTQRTCCWPKWIPAGACAAMWKRFARPASRRQKWFGNCWRRGLKVLLRNQFHSTLSSKDYGTC